MQVFGRRLADKNVLSPKIGPDPDFFNRLLTYFVAGLYCRADSARMVASVWTKITLSTG